MGAAAGPNPLLLPWLLLDGFESIQHSFTPGSALTACLELGGKNVHAPFPLNLQSGSKYEATWLGRDQSSTGDCLLNAGQTNAKRRCSEEA